MAASVGDLVAHLDADTVKFNAALRQSQAQLQALGWQMDKTFTGAQMAGGGANNKVGQSITQIGFALQDFSAVLQGGGGLGRAIGAVSNNVAMLGAAFGPWGMAITSVGAALGGMLLPKLLEGNDSTSEFARQQRQSQEATDRLVASIERQAKAQKELNQLIEEGTEKQVKAAQKNNQNELETLQKEIKARGDAMRNEAFKALAAEREAAAGVFGDAWKTVKGQMAGDPVDQGERARNARNTFGRMLEDRGPAGIFDEGGRLRGNFLKEFDDPKQTERFGKMRDQMLELQAREKELMEQQKRLEGVKPEARARDGIKESAEGFRQEMKAFEEGMQRKQKLWDDTRGHLEKYTQRMEELKAMRIAGEIDDDQFMRGANKAALERPKVATQNQALEFGSAAAISAMIDNLAQNQERDEQLRLAKQALDEAKEQVRLLKSVEKAVTDWRPVELAP